MKEENEIEISVFDDEWFLGIWMPGDINFCNDLSYFEKYLWALIDQYSRTSYFYISNKKLSQIFNKSRASVSRAIRTLEKRGHIKIIYNDNRRLLQSKLGR